jgi:heat-inducible transcriptional repressor
MATPEIDTRSREVLKALIQLHVATGEPVGSENLSRVLGRPLSPATIRNIMAELERQGYLAHPHTSAGRVPTDEGYRVFVDSLMGHEPLQPREAAAIDGALRAGEAAPSQVLENASRVLSTLSRNVGFVLTPDIGRASFMHIDLVRLPHPRILVVMVSRTGIVTNKVIELEEQLGQDELQTCANYLNTHFAGMGLAEIRGRLLDLMGEEKALYDSLLQRVISVGERAFAADTTDGDHGNVYLDGTANILEKPEFEDLDRMRALFKTFEEKSRLVRLLNACISGDGMRIIIGHENPDPELRDLALVTAGYPVGGEPWGLGVMGSTRMEYARMIALVDHVSRAVRRVLAEMET